MRERAEAAEDSGGGAGVFTEMDARTGVGATVQSGGLRACQVWGGAFISSADDNKSFDVITVQKCGLCVPDQILLSEAVKVHVTQSMDEGLPFVQL